MKVINFCGSAELANQQRHTDLAHVMKQRYIDVELIDEYAKNWYWQEANTCWQINSPFWRNKIADCTTQAQKPDRIRRNRLPLFLSAFYVPDDYPASFPVLVWTCSVITTTSTSFLERNHPYNPVGRLQTESGVRQRCGAHENIVACQQHPIHGHAKDCVPMTVMECWA